MDDNPFNQVYSALWTAALGHPDLPAYVKPGNRPRFDDAKDRNPLKDTLASADLPELLLMPLGLQGNLRVSSSGTRFDKRWMWIISTGDLRIDDFLHPLEWILFTSMVVAQKSLLSLKYAQEQFVKRMATVDGVTGQSELQRESNIRGWSSVLTIEVEMHFKTSKLVNEANF